MSRNSCRARDPDRGRAAATARETRFGDRCRAEGLVEAERRKREDRGASGQRLGNPAHERKALRARDEERTRAAVAVNRALDVPQELGGVLHLVDDGWSWESFEERAGREPGLFRPRRVIE